MLLFAIVTLLLQIIQSTLVLVADENNGDVDCVEKTSFDRDALLLVNYITLGTVILCLCLLTYLFLFHLYLVKNKLTTFKYIRIKNSINRKSRFVTKVTIGENDKEENNDGSVSETENETVNQTVYTLKEILGCKKHRIR